MKKTLFFILGIIGSLNLFAQEKNDEQEITNIEYNLALLEKIRISANLIPGQKPDEIRYIKFAESPRTLAQTIEGGDGSSYIQARTAYQIMFSKEWVMVDAGMDREVHDFFGAGLQQPYFQSANDSLQQALKKAKEIIITHEHGDHVSGVIRTLYYKEVAPKTIFTKQMANTLINSPQMPQIQLKKEQLKDYNVVDFQDILPVSPGIVLIKAPGHTPGEIMVYVQLKSGKEYLLAGDVSWSYKGIEEKRQKPQNQIKRIGEDEVKIQFQLDWLNELTKKDIQIIVSHDDIIQPKLVQKQILKKGLILK
ncbi:MULTISPECIES: MBL fold metallo-hydrolase [Sphingobacterium]|uniref:MBL fold metallo-hydrolase n=1 Tax=Sphingobacterium TaxID=28453 RepID=UPI00257B9E40|nr:MULTISPECIES: MBL fold metallo-hydrolase [Sphingobacterium]